MKTRNLFFAALTCLAFAACSDDDNAVQNPQKEDVVDRSYLAVQLSIPGLPGATTRAGEYAEANATELKVADVAFFFYNGNGQPAADPCYVTIDNSESFWNNITHDDDPTTDEDKESNLVLMVHNAQADLSQVVAVLNTTSTIKTLAKNGGAGGTISDNQTNITDGVSTTFTTTLEQLRKELISTKNGENTTYYTVPVISGSSTTGDVTTLTYSTNSEKGCLMSNSAYLHKYTYSTGGGTATGHTPRYATQVNRNQHFKESEDLAKQNPLIIHVERVEARVSVIAPDAEEPNDKTVDGKILYKLQEQTDNTDIQAQNGGSNVQLYFRIDGWWLNNTNKDSYLIKDFNNSYDSDWNDETEYRSYWAYSWRENSISDALGHGKHLGNQLNMYDKYCLENTTQTTWNYADQTSGSTENVSVTTATQVVVAGQVVDESGQPQNVVSYNNKYYIDTEFLKEVANSLNSAGFKKKVGDAEATPIESSDLQLITPTYTGSTDDATLRDYEAKVAMNLAEGTSIVKEGITEEKINEAVQEILNVYGNVKYWKEGKTYFFTRVKHDYNASGIGQADAVIRNHWYKVNVTGFYGLGTPVPNPEIPIIPVTPEDDKVSFMACKIAVLKYRTVSQDVTLGGEDAKNQQ